MDIRIGEKIRALRKEKGISQEILAQYLSVSFQAVSKWENGTTMPDITMIPAIASFFHVSTDELFDFNMLEIEKRVSEICDEAYKYRFSDTARSEQILRDGLKQYPGNDIILNNLLYTMRSPERAQEVIELCTVLIESTKYEDVKYDALRILAETYKEQGEDALCKATIERIPEIYFSKLELDAELLEGAQMCAAAWGQKYLSAHTLLNMFLRIADYHEAEGERDQAMQQLNLACRIAEVMQDDVNVPGNDKTFYQMQGEEIHKRAKERLAKLRKQKPKSE